MLGYRIAGLLIGGALAMQAQAAHAEFLWDFSMEGEITYADAGGVSMWGVDVGERMTVDATFTSESDTIGSEAFLFGEPVGNSLRFTFGEDSHSGETVFIDDFDALFVEDIPIIEFHGLEFWKENHAPRMVFSDGEFDHIDIHVRGVARQTETFGGDPMPVRFVTSAADPSFGGDLPPDIQGSDFAGHWGSSEIIAGDWDTDTAMLTMRESESTPIPVPASAALFGFGLLALGAASYRRR